MRYLKDLTRAELIKIEHYNRMLEDLPELKRMNKEDLINTVLDSEYLQEDDETWMYGFDMAENYGEDSI